MISPWAVQFYVEHIGLDLESRFPDLFYISPMFVDAEHDKVWNITFPESVAVVSYFNHTLILPRLTFPESVLEIFEDWNMYRDTENISEGLERFMNPFGSGREREKEEVPVFFSNTLINQVLTPFLTPEIL